MASFRSFLRDTGGASALLFGLALPGLALAVGGGIDLSRAAARHQRIATAVELGCTQAAKEITYQSSLKGADPAKDYRPVVTKIVNQKLVDEGLTGVTASNTIAGDVITLVARGSSANAFGGILGFETVSLTVTRTCKILPPEAAAGKVLFSESFEDQHNVASNSWTVLKNWNGWSTRSGEGGIEINGIPQLSGNVIRFGNFFAELDSHCYTSNCKTNSAMYREFKDLTPGNYELRYWYISRVRNPAYGSEEICTGRYPENSTNPRWDSKISNWPLNFGKTLDKYNWEEQTNRIEVFFEKSTTSTTPASGTMVDVCVHSDHWSERIIPLNVTTKGNYRIYFRAAGREDTYGGLIDYIRFCSGKCP